MCSIRTRRAIHLSNIVRTFWPKLVGKYYSWVPERWVQRPCVSRHMTESLCDRCHFAQRDGNRSCITSGFVSGRLGGLCVGGQGGFMLQTYCLAPSCYC